MTWLTSLPAERESASTIAAPLMPAPGALFAPFMALSLASEATPPCAPALLTTGLAVVIGLRLALLFAIGTPWRGSITVSGQPIDAVAHDQSTRFFHR